jgi:hypothetical protein
MPPRSAAALTLMQFCRCCLTRQGVQRKRSWRFGLGKRESPRIVRPAACKGQHSFVAFYPHTQVGRDHGTAADRKKGPPLEAFYLAPHQRENQGYSERNHDYGESQQIEHEHLPSLPGDFQHG